MKDVVATDSGLIAVGGQLVRVHEGIPAGIDAGVQATVWTSPDGTTWSRIPHAETDTATESLELRMVMNSVAEGGPGLIAVGNEGNDSGPPRGAVWVARP